MQISLNIIDILCLHIFFWIRSNSRIQKKICRHKMSIMFNEICINEEMLPKYTYIYIYIYIYICNKEIILSLSLSLYIYIYIYIYTEMYNCKKKKTRYLANDFIYS